MKNKKMVLTILLVLIVLVAVILFTVLIVGSINKKKIDEFYNTVETAACKYGKEEGFTETICNGFESLCKIKYSKLIEVKYLDKKLTNPITKEKISDNTSDYIEITWEDDKMICTYKEGKK